MTTKMAPHTQGGNLTIKQQYQPHQWPWNTSNNTNAATGTAPGTAATNSNNTPNTAISNNSNSNNSNNNPPSAGTNTLTLTTTQQQQQQQQNTALTAAAAAASISVTPINKLKRLQPTQPTSSSVAASAEPSRSNSSSTNTIANGAKRIRSTSVETTSNKSVGTNTASAYGGPPSLVAVGSGLSATAAVATTKKLTQMAIVAASNISNHQQISTGTATTTTITKNHTKNFTASGNEQAAANKITGYFKSQMKTTNTFNNLKKNIKTIAGRATTLKTTATTAETEAEITTTTELLTTTSTVIKTATVASAGSLKSNNANLKNYLLFQQHQQQQQQQQQAATTTLKKVERKTARIAPTVSLTRKVGQTTQGGSLGVGQPKKPVTIAPRTADPKLAINQPKPPQQELVKSQQPTVLLTAIRIPQQQQQQQPQQQSSQTQSNQKQQQQAQQQFKQAVQQQPQINSPPRTPTKLGSTMFQFHPQTTAVMPNLVQIPNLVPTQAASSASNKLPAASVVSTATSSPTTTNLLMNSAAARLNNGTTQLFMNGAVIKLHQLQQQQQQTLATSSGQPVSTAQQQTLAMEAVNMSLLAKQAAASNPSQAPTGKTYALHTQQPAAQLFQQASATTTAFAPQQLFMTPAGGFLVNAATIPMLASGFQQALAPAGIPALHPLQPSQPQQPTQLPNFTAAILQQQQQQQQQQVQSNIQQLLANLQATAKLGQGPQFVPISSHLFLNQPTPTLTTSPITISTSTLPSGSPTVAQPLSPPPLVATVPTYSTTSKPIMNTLSNQKIIIASGTAATAKPPPPIKPISSSEPPKLVPVQLNKPSISITPVLSTNPPKLVPPASSVPVPKLVLSASVASKATSTKPNLPVPALAPASHQVTATIPQPVASPRVIDNKSPPALNPLTLDCGSSNDSGIVVNSSDSEDKSLTIDLCSPGTPDSSPQKKDEDSRKTASPSPPPTPEMEPATPTESTEPEDQPNSPPPPPAPEPALPPLRLLPSATVDSTQPSAQPLPPSQTSPKSLVLELIKSKLDEEPPQESMSSDQDSTNLNSPLDDQQPPSSAAPSESQRSTTPVDLQSPPSIETDFLNAPPATECAKSPILSQPKTIRFPALNGAHHKFGRKGFRRLSDGRLFGVCYWSECNAQFDTSWHLQDHLQIQHVNSQSGPFVCLWDGCKVYNKESCSRKWLDRHVQSHGGTKSHKCIVPGCGMRFGSQLALEKHVNSHFTNTDNAGSGKRSSDLPLPKVLRKTGKKLRYRRQPWSARRFDFFDIGVMEGLQHRLILAGSVASARYGTVTFQGQAAGRRVTSGGMAEVFVKWHPRDVISDDWIPEAEVSLTKEVSIYELNPDQRFELESQLSTNRKANAELLSCLSELNQKLAAVVQQQDSTPCSSSSSSSSSSGCCSGSSSSISTPIPFNSRTSPKKLRKPPKEPAAAIAATTLSSVLSSSASSLLSSGCSSSSSSSSSGSSTTS